MEKLLSALVISASLVSLSPQAFADPVTDLSGYWKGPYQAKSGACTTTTESTAILYIDKVNATDDNNATFTGTLQLANFPSEAVNSTIPDFSQPQQISGAVSYSSIFIFYNGQQIFQNGMGYIKDLNPAGITFQDAYPYAGGPCHIMVGYPEYLNKSVQNQSHRK